MKPKRNGYSKQHPVMQAIAAATPAVTAEHYGALLFSILERHNKRLWANIQLPHTLKSRFPVWQIERCQKWK